MSVALDILRTYRAPRSIILRRIGDVAREDKALVTLMAACVLIFVSKWPGAARQSFQESDVELNFLLASHLFTWLLVAPLFFYAVTWLVQLVLRALRRQVSGFEVRMATFWPLLAAAPLWLLTGLSNGFVGASLTTDIVAIVALAVFFFFWLSGLSAIGKTSIEQAAG